MKTRYIFYTLLLFISSFYSCEKDSIPYEEASNSKDGALVYIAKARDGIQTLKTFSIEDEKFLAADTVKFNVGFGALGLPAQNIPVTLSKDTKVLDSINNIQEINKEEKYEPFPEDAYALSTLDLTIPKEGEYSNYSELIYNPEKFDMDKSYLLALTITDASGYTINPKVKTIVYSVSKVVIPDPEPQLYDKANWEVIDFSSEQTSGEGEGNGIATAIIDGDANTYWHSCYTCAESYEYPHYLTVDMKEELDVDGLQIVQRAGGSRNFDDYEIQVSNDNTEWRSLGDFNLLQIPSPQDVPFSEMETFRYFKIIMKSSYDGQPFASLAEIGAFIIE